MTKYNSRADRRKAERKALKARKRKTLASLAMAGTMTVTPFLSMGAAVAAPPAVTQMASQASSISSPTISGFSMEKDTLTATFLVDKANPQPVFEMNAVGTEDNSNFQAISDARDEALKVYEDLNSIAPQMESEFAGWSSVDFITSDTGTIEAHLANGSIHEFDTLEDAKAAQRVVIDDYVNFQREYTKAVNEYELTQNNLDNYKPNVSKTNYTLTIDATESGWDGPFNDASGWSIQEGGYLDVDGAPAGAEFHIVSNENAVMVVNVTFESDINFNTRVNTEMVVEEEAPEELPVISHSILEDRSIDIEMDPNGETVNLDLVSGVQLAEGASFESLGLSYGSHDDEYAYFQGSVWSSNVEYSVEGNNVWAQSYSQTEAETLAFSYQITDTLGNTYAGNITVTALPAGALPGLNPVTYDKDDSRTAFRDVTRTLGVLWKGQVERGNYVNYGSGRIVGATNANATRDAGVGYQGERIALRPTANDIAGPRTRDDDNRDESYDPNGQKNVFAFSTLQIKDPVTGLWTSTSYEGKHGKVSVLPAEGTADAVLGADNQYAEAVVAFDPRDRSALISEQTEYRIGIVKHGADVDAAQFWANATEGDYVSSTITFGIQEWAQSQFNSEAPYCVTPDTILDNLEDREHGSFLNVSDYRAHSGTATGAPQDRMCVPVGVADEAQVEAGETTIIDVLRNDQHLSSYEHVPAFEENNYRWNPDTLRIIDANGNAVLSTETENGFWKVEDGKLSFTAKEGITGTQREQIKYSATQIFTGNPDADYAPYIEFMTKRDGGTISGIATTVLINGVEVPEVPVVPEPEPEVPVVPEPEPEVPVVPEPEPEVPVVPEPEVPVVPEPEVPVVPEPEVPVVPEPEPEPEVPVVPEPEPEVPVVPEPEVPVVPEPEVPVVPEPEVPVVPEPEVPVVPEPEVPVVPEPEVPVVPEPEVPVVPEPEVPVVPEPEVPVVPEPEVPVVPEPEPTPEVPEVTPEPTPEVPEITLTPEVVLTPAVPEAPSISDSADGETPTFSGVEMEILDFLALFAGVGAMGAIATLTVRKQRQQAVK